MIKKFQFAEFGYEVEIGAVARQADSAVWFRQGDTIILSTVCTAPSKEFPGFLPLTIDYREQFSAAGKIPGGYYKREGKFTDKEVLTSRLVDRAVRPLFPSNFFDQIQILATVYSVDKQYPPSNLALLATSLALSISKIPFMGPVGVVEIARTAGNEQWIVNPSYEVSLKSNLRLVFAGTDEGICMVEGSADELSEKDFLDAMFFAHDIIKKLVAWQESIIKELGVVKAEIKDEYNWATWESRVDKFLTHEHVRNTYIEDKVQRNEYLDTIRAAFSEQYAKEIEETKVPEKVIDYMFDAILKLKVTELIFELQKRIDGRNFDQVRAISTQVGILPSTHGSALFTRGRTQALTMVTLGSGQDEQRIEGIMGSGDEENNSFMLHYNFPPFSVGEVRMMRGVGRREVGHGYLAASALKAMLPSKEAFPYTIRIVADMLESDGSTSMATVCGSTMGLMDTGVPIKKMVGGVAMGLLLSVKKNFVVLTDISGFEDAFGFMDFKVAGTEQGITAVQMDVKYKGGLSRDVFAAALESARKGRIHILGEMQKVMSKPNPTLSPLVPKVVSFKIETDKIGTIIGPGGKMIREIIEKTSVASIDISDDGTVKIFGVSLEAIDKAQRWVKTLSGQIERGSIWNGIIRRQAEFGLFVELVPGLDGLVHVSNIPREQQRDFMRIYQVGQTVKVEVVDYEKESGRIRLRLLEGSSNDTKQ